MAELDPHASFENLYRAAERGDLSLPWDRTEAHPLIREWVEHVDGTGRRALVVGAGLGMDAEAVAARGFEVLAFDLSRTAISMARARRPASTVDYQVADLLEPPPAWTRAFDLVVESLTVQSLPPEHHARAARNIAGFVGPGGTLLAVATARDDATVPEGKPWPLARAEIEAFAVDGLAAVRIELVRAPDTPDRWRAEFARPASGAGPTVS